MPGFLALDDAGCTLAIFDFEDTGIIAFDWEDMARGPSPDSEPALWFGDIGDNARARPRISVYRVDEPRVRTTPDECPSARQRLVPATRFDLTYEDGPHDAEALLVHPRTGRLFIVSKVGGGEEADLYAAPAELRAKRANVLRRVAGIPDMASVTAGDIDPDGSRLALRNYQSAFEWPIPGDDVAGAFAAEPRTIALPPMPQGEAITYERDGAALVTTSEGAGSVVVRVPDHP